jgi:hypothetical protein
MNSQKTKRVKNSSLHVIYMLRGSSIIIRSVCQLLFGFVLIEMYQLTQLIEWRLHGEPKNGTGNRGLPPNQSTVLRCKQATKFIEHPSSSQRKVIDASSDNFIGRGNIRLFCQLLLIKWALPKKGDQRPLTHSQLSYTALLLYSKPPSNISFSQNPPFLFFTFLFGRLPRTPTEACETVCNGSECITCLCELMNLG